MKNIINKIFIGVFVVLFVFSIDKVANVKAEKSSFIIENVSLEDMSKDTEGTVTSFNSNEIINNILFNKLNDRVIYNITIKNNLGKKIKILSIEDNNKNEYITYQYDKHENEEINSNGRLNLKVKATYSKKVEDHKQNIQNNNVSFTIKYLDGNGEVLGAIVESNPKTGDSITFNIVLLIISVVGIIACIVFDKKRIKNLSILLVISLALIPAVVKAIEDSYTFNLKSTYTISLGKIDIDVENENKWKPSKKVTINYENIYENNDKVINQYSLDNGLNWKKYTGPITLNTNNVLVKTRTILADSNEVLVSNEKMVAKIDPVVPTISMNLGTRYYSGQELDLASVTTTTYGESGATVKWTIENVEVTNMSETNKIDKMDSEYSTKVVATIKTGSGLTATYTSPTLIVQYALWDDFLVGPITRDNIHSIKFGSWDDKPTNYTGVEDISYNDHDVVFEYYTLDNITNLYDVYITSPYGYTRYYKDDMRIHIANDYNMIGLNNNSTDRTRGLFSYMPNMETIDFEYLDMFNITNTAHLFDMIDYSAYYWDSHSSLKSITWGKKFNTINVTDMSSMFAGLDKLEEIDLSSFNMKNVKNIQGMFAFAKSLETIEVSNWDTSNVEYVCAIFYNTPALRNLDVSKWDTSNMTEMHQMFYKSGIKQLDLSKWDTSNITDMEGMFENVDIEVLDLSTFNTSKVTNMSYMFYGYLGKILNVSNFDTANVTNMESIFLYAENLEHLDLSGWDTSNVTTMEFAFSCMYKLKSLDIKNLNLSNVSDLIGTFYNSKLLTNIYVKEMPTYKAGANKTYMWNSAGTNTFTVWDYENDGSPLNQ